MRSTSNAGELPSALCLNDFIPSLARGLYRSDLSGFSQLGQAFIFFAGIDDIDLFSFLFLSVCYE